MLKFFRNIRRTLLSDNKTGKYLKYATGEVILVMVGILLALQVNNWNEKRKNNLQELQLLKSCKTGLQKDLHDINLNINILSRGIASSELILSLLKNNNPYVDSLSKHFSHVMVPIRFIHSTSAFETLKAKGVDMISNEKLRNKIINVYDSEYNYFLKQEDEYSKELNRGLTEIFPLRFIESYVFDLDSIDDTVGRIVPINFRSLSSDQEFLYYWKSFKNRTINFKDFSYRRLRREVVNLLEEIKQELKRF